MNVANQHAAPLPSVALPHNDQNHIQIWQYLLEKARKKIALADWDGACIVYKQAFAITEQMLCSQCEHSCHSQCAVQRYLTTAEEFAFAMRQNDYDCAVELFIAQIKANLTQQQTDVTINKLTRRLTQLSVLPKQELEPLYKQCLPSSA